MSKLDNLSKEQLIEMVKQLKQRKKFGLVWEDKPENVVEQCKKELPVLEEVKDKEVISDENLLVNLLIEGDNYHALTVLNYTHAGKIDVIYIDPPYNTGNKDFKYNDKYVERDDTYRHSKWLSFMERRLLLAKNLLKRDGIICISIDENEYAELKVLCDSIFFEENRLITDHIKVRYENKQTRDITFLPLMEYVLVYSKAKGFSPNLPTEKYSLDSFVYEVKELKEGNIEILDGKKYQVFKKNEWVVTKHKESNVKYLKEIWISGSIYSDISYGKIYQKIVEPRVKIDGEGSLYKIFGHGDDGLGYRYYTNPLKIGANRGKTYSGVPLKRLEEIKEGTAVKYKPITNLYDFAADFGNIRHEGGIGFNSGKKPIKMIKELINYHKSKNILVLDFFAGSGSTGHAVLELNKDDGGNRKFILCTNNENGIAEEVCYPRVKKVIEGYSDVKGIPANLKYFKTSFVKKSTVTDDTRGELVNKSVEMICVKEGTFKEVVNNADFKVYKDSKHSTGILFNLEKLSGFKKAIEALKMPSNIYVFSLSNDTYNSDFEDLTVKHKLCPIPESILEVYRKLFKE